MGGINYRNAFVKVLNEILEYIKNDPVLREFWLKLEKESSVSSPLQKLKRFREFRSPQFDELRLRYVERNPMSFDVLPEELITPDHVLTALPLGMVYIDSFPKRLRNDPLFMDVALATRDSLCLQVPSDELTYVNFTNHVNRDYKFFGMLPEMYHHYPKQVTTKFIDDKIDSNEWLFGKIFPEEKFKPQGNKGLAAIIRNAGNMQKYISEKTNLKGKSSIQQRVSHRKMFLEYALRVISRYTVEEVASCIRNNHQLEVAARVYPLDDLMRMPNKMNMAKRGAALERALGL